MTPSLRVVCALILLPGCIDAFLPGRLSYDVRSIGISYLTLFNQETKESTTEANWKGDWVFRRQRLDLIDEHFRSFRQDLLIFDEMMARSAAESDQEILSSGALANYSWQTLSIKDREEHDNTESIATLSQLPIRVPFRSKEEITYATLPSGGKIGIFSALLEQDKITIVYLNVQENDFSDKGIKALNDKIYEFLNKHERCLTRVIVAGNFAIASNHPRYLKWLSELELVDTAQNFCENEAACYTEVPQNELYVAAHGEHLPSRASRILVHRSAYILNAKRIFDLDAGKEIFGIEKFGMRKLWPSDHQGWQTQVRLARCPKDGI